MTEGVSGVKDGGLSPKVQNKDCCGTLSLPSVLQYEQLEQHSQVQYSLDGLGFTLHVTQLVDSDSQIQQPFRVDATVHFFNCRNECEMEINVQVRFIMF